MREKIIELEELAKSLEPGKEEREALRSKVIDYTEQFLDEIGGIPAYFKEKDGKNEISKTEPGKEILPIDEIINRLKVEMDREGINPASGGHLGYIPGGGIYASSLADYWGDITNRYAGVFYANPGAVKIENKMIRWTADLMGYPETAHGNLTSGGSIANLIGIVSARHAKNIHATIIPSSCIYFTKQAHHSVAKAIQIAALHECQIRYVEMDENFRMDVVDLEKKVKEDIARGLNPFLVVGSAGTTDVGAIDPMEEISRISRENNLWFHVDAAYGGFFILVDEIKQKFKGIELSDSMSVDPHKGLFLPYGLGISLVREREHMKKAFAFQASYLQDITAAQDEVNPMDVSPEMTKHFRGLRIWLPLLLYGTEPFRACLEEKLFLARYFHQEIKKVDGFDVGLYPQLSVVTFRYTDGGEDNEAINRRILEEVLKDGRVFFSSTTIQGNFTLRLAILSFRTHLQTIDLTLEIIKEKTALVVKEFQKIESPVN
ncbi:MAG: aminotransferase class V-fold PLP-dependent enzyme [Cyclobacteriaceae bacterium]|nr:aminotransferase class V-fold PLP-dependent enzyme [Cyclobacteriaceae bacterium]